MICCNAQKHITYSDNLVFQDVRQHNVPFYTSLYMHLHSILYIAVQCHGPGLCMQLSSLHKQLPLRTRPLYFLSHACIDIHFLCTAANIYGLLPFLAQASCCLLIPRRCLHRNLPSDRVPVACASIQCSVLNKHNYGVKMPQGAA